MHRIARQTVELQVATDVAAREVHEELSEALASRMSPVLDQVLTDACPPEITLRINRLEIDAGIVSREQLIEAIVAAARAQLPARLAVLARDDAGARDAQRTRADARVTAAGDAIDRLSEQEVALERVAALLGHGVVTWRDPSLTREALEATLLGLIESAPAALRGLLQRLPAARVAVRIWAQLSVSARHQLLGWLGVTHPADLDVALTAWTAVLAAAEDTAGRRLVSAPGRQIGAWLHAEAWTLAVSGRLSGRSVRAMGERIVATLAGGAAPAESLAFVELIRAAAGRLLAPQSEVLSFLSETAATMERTSKTSVPGRSDVAPMDADVAVFRARNARDVSTTPGLGEEREALGTSGQMRPAPDAVGEDPHAIERARQRIAESVDAVRRETSYRRLDAAGSEPLWAGHAGAVIVWPFLPGLFEACGLIAEKRFVDDAARERAVLLTAHLVDGATEWGEHDLLVEKTLCGCAPDAPMAAALELRPDEQRQATELLASVIQHWAALKSTSVDGLRRAFLCRTGTLTAIASGWKLDIPRAGHDVLLDRLPWGIGVVLLPWMEQPLHVEW